MWVTILFKSGKVIETMIKTLSELDDYYDITDIVRIEMGTTMDTIRLK